MLQSEEIRAMAVDEMEEKVSALKRDLLNLRLELKTGKLEKHARIQEIRKSIARLLTIFGEEKRKLLHKEAGTKKVIP